MKKVIICMALLMGGATVTPWITPIHAMEAMASERTVSACKFLRGGAKIWNHSIRVVETDEGYEAIFGGSRYTVYSSDRDGFRYMFYAGSTPWYFNM